MTADTTAPAVVPVRRAMWSAPIMPAPTTPTWSSLVLMALCFLLAVGLAGAGQRRAAEDVLPGARGDAERKVDLHARHVLLDDGERLRVDRRGRLDDGGEVGQAGRRLDHDLAGGVGEGDVVLEHLEEQLGIDLLEVEVADPGGIRLD